MKLEEWLALPATEENAMFVTKPMLVTELHDRPFVL